MKAQLHLYNTLGRQKQEFTPLKKTVTLYNCGPTVYHDQHIGNFRTSLAVDLLKRTLLYFGYSVKHITNITDVGHLTNEAEDSGEDKMEIGARREGLTAKQVARKYEKQYRLGIKALNIVPPYKWTRATEHIKEQIALIATLEKKGFTYLTSDGVYFDSTKFPHYGELAGLAAMKMQAGIRVDMGEKKHPTDFALWKFAAPDVKRQMEWKSPWGVGFPGWHIECSAMAMKYLGDTIDIHAGGIDLITPHHTNEIAQSEAATGKQFVRFWVHGAFVLSGEEKMAKSKGNVQNLEWITEQGFSLLDYRYLVLQTHYRKELNVTSEALAGAHVARTKLMEFVATAPKRGSVITAAREQFVETLSDDINVPRALASMWDVVHSSASPADKRATLLEFDAVFGLGLAQAKAPKKISMPAEVKKLLDARATARAEKNWKASDELRDKIKALGFEVKDTPEGQTIEHVLY